MASVTQKIPNYIAGISEQPDELKFPGQVRDLLNCVPDVTRQLVKRPGSRFVMDVNDTANGSWSSYYRDPDNQYIILIRRDGTVAVYNVADPGGTPPSVTGFAAPIPFTNTPSDIDPQGVPPVNLLTNPEPYFEHTQPGSLQFLTIEDFTYVTNREINPRMTAATANAADLTVFDAYVEVKILAYGREYEFEINPVGAGANQPVTFTTTADPTEQISINQIINGTPAVPGGAPAVPGWIEQLQALDGVIDASVVQIGNGVYFRRTTDFAINVLDTQTINGFTSQVNSFDRLPFQCSNGMIVEVTNTDESDEDGFFVIFQGEGGQDGVGVWEETAEPGVNTTFDPARMPHVIRRNANGSFTVAQGNYATRQVGNDDTNPLPSFIDNTTPTADGLPINKLLLFRNRLCFLSSTNAVFAQAGALGSADAPIDFFSTSVLVLSPTDPIDIAASSRRPATLFDGIEINNGMVLFGATQQFLLTSEDSNVGFAPDTAKITNIGNYAYSNRVPPISLGTTVSFTNTGGASFRFFQLDEIESTGEPNATELSKVVQLLLPDTLISLAESGEGNLVLFANEDIGRQNEVWGYRYYDVNNERKQSAWFRWELPGDVLYHGVMRETYYAVLRVNNQNKIFAFDIAETVNSALLNDKFRIHLDGRQDIDVSASNVTYDATTNDTTFDVPQGLQNFTTLEIERAQVNTNVSNGTNVATTNVKGKGKGLTVDVTVNTSEQITACTIDAAGTGYFNGDTFTIDGYPGSLIQYLEGKIYAFNRVDGTTEPVTLNTGPTPWRGTVQGDWRFTNTGSDFYIGYLFNMSVQIPTFYVTEDKNQAVRADTRASLVIHRFNIEAGASGVFTTTMDRLGYDPYSEIYYPNTMNSYLANSPMIAESLTRTIPCYTRNKNMDIELSSRHPSPFTLFSISWEGDYSNKYYRPVGAK